MTPSEFLLLGLVMISVVVVAYITTDRPKLPASAPPEVTRWRRFRVHAADIAHGEKGTLIAEEEPGGISLQLLAAPTESMPLHAGSLASKSALITLKRRWLRIHPVWTLRLRGRPWLALKLTGGRDFPEIRAAHRRPPSFAPEPADIELHGSLSEREYEIRIDGRLTGSVSWQEGEDVADDETGWYYLETIKAAEPLPLLGLTLALEAAASVQGAPVEIEIVDDEEIDIDVQAS